MKNEKGFTLIEVLATLSILLIVSSLIYGVFFGVNKNYKNLSQNNNIDQQVNLIFSTIKNYHTQNNVYEIKYASGYYLIGAPTASNQLGLDPIEYIKIDNDNIADLATKSISITTSTRKSIRVTLKFISQTKEYSTIIKRY